MIRTALLLGISLCVLAAETEVPAYTSSGALVLPADYREWIFLSAGLGMTYGPLAARSDEAPRFENVFVTRAAYRGFRESGRWPDKTMFVLEIRTSESKGSINRGGHYQTEVAGIEAEVKENGKWTFFGFGKSGTEGKALARTESCYACHAANGAVDNTFVQFYPTLMGIAREHGTVK